MEHEEYLKAVATVMGNHSPLARQNAQRIEWAFESLLEAALIAGRGVKPVTIQKTIPNILFRLAAEVDWLPYLDDNGKALPDRVGPLDQSGYGVSEALWDGFLRLLPMEEFEDFITVGKAVGNWKHPTPKELIEEFIRTRRRYYQTKAWLEKQMYESADYPFSKHAAHQFIKLRVREPKGLQIPKAPGLRQARVLVKIFKREEPSKYAALTPEMFFWRPA